MAHVNSTSKGLPQWLGTEKPERADFNDAFSKIDTLMAPLHIQGKFATLEDLETAFPTGDGNNSYLVDGTIYVWAGDGWYPTGVDLAGYYTKAESDALLDDKADTSDLAGKADGDESGNALYANQLTIARNINGVEFDGTADITVDSPKIINGSLTVWQRGTSFASPTNAYGPDRFMLNGSGTASRHSSGRGATITGTLNIRYWMESIDFLRLPDPVTVHWFDDTLHSKTTAKSSITLDSNNNALVFNEDISDKTLQWVNLSPYPSTLTRGEELALCQRYGIDLPAKQTYATGQVYIGVFKAQSTTLAYGIIPIPKTFRTLPTISYSSGLNTWNGTLSIPVTNISIQGIGSGTLQARINVSDGLVVGDTYIAYVDNKASTTLFADAEIY